MGRERKSTGCKLLGEELRRLRGPRTLMDIVEISRSKPLSLRISPLSAPTLSQIESGLTLPSLTTMHALSVVYRVSTQHFLNLIVEERLVGEGTSLPDTEKETEAARLQAIETQDWYQALSLCIHGERLARSEPRRVAWRARRATYLGQIGMRDEAVAILMDCSASAELPATTRHQIHANLVAQLIGQGLLPMAEALLQDCLSSTELEEVVRRELLRLRIRLTIERHVAGLVECEREYREAHNTIEDLLAAGPEPVPGYSFGLEATEAFLHHLLGNSALALRDLRNLLRTAEKDDNSWKRVTAGFYLGLCVLAVGKKREARSILEEVASVATRSGYNDDAFAAYFELSCIPGLDEKSRARFLKRCGRIAPLVTTRCGRMRAFEAMQAGP